MLEKVAKMDKMMKEHFYNEFGDQMGEKFYNSMLRHATEKLQGIYLALKSKNREDLMRFFHSLKGLMLQAGLNDMSSKAKILEFDTRDGMELDIINLKQKELLEDLKFFLETKTNSNIG